MSTKEKIESLARQKVLILDGAMGTMIQKYKLEESDFRGEQFKDYHLSVQGNNDMLNITQPEIIEEIHLQYFEAGADIIETNTFSSQFISMADYDMEEYVYELNYQGAKRAVAAREKYYSKHGSESPKFIAGAIGPTNRTASLSPKVNDPGFRNITFDELGKAYKEQAKALIEGGVDILLVETIFDTLNAKAAFFAIEELLDEMGIEVPLMASGTITDASGRTLSGQTPQAFAISLSHVPLTSIGFNCGLGADQLLSHVETLANESTTMVSAYANAGLPNAMGQYDQTPEIMKGLTEPYLSKGLVNIIGGCCGSTPEHIRQIAEIAKNYQPRKF